MKSTLVWCSAVVFVVLYTEVLEASEPFRMKRQSGRYGASGGIGGAGGGPSGGFNYRPGPNLGYNIRPVSNGNKVGGLGSPLGVGSGGPGGGGFVQSNLNSGIKSSLSSAGGAGSGGGPARPLGVGGFSFGGKASGHPAYGPSFALNNGAVIAGRPQSQPVARPSYQSGGYRGSPNGRPSSGYQLN